jgi:hypothetical protein
LITFIERLPACCRVVVGSRTEPQLALHRLARAVSCSKCATASSGSHPPKSAR